MSEFTRDIDADEEDFRYIAALFPAGGSPAITLAYIARVRELTAENDRLRGLLSGDAKIRRLEYSPETGLECEVEHWAVKHLAANFFESLGNAPNFVTTTVSHPDHGAVEVTVRRFEGKPTAAVLAELRAENDKLRAELAKWRELGPWWAVRNDEGDPVLAGPDYSRRLLTNDREDAEDFADSVEGTVVEYTGAENG